MPETETQEPTTPTSKPTTNPLARFIGGGQMQVFDNGSPVVCVEISEVKEETDCNGKKVLIVKGKRAWRMYGVWEPKSGLIYYIENLKDLPENADILSGTGETGTAFTFLVVTCSVLLLPTNHTLAWIMPECTGDLEYELISLRGNDVHIGSSYDKDCHTLTITLLGRGESLVHLIEPVVFKTQWWNVTEFSIDSIQKLEDGSYKVGGIMKTDDDMTHGRARVTGIGTTIQEAIDNC